VVAQFIEYAGGLAATAAELEQLDIALTALGATGGEA
jgi:hypothetical protein